MFPTGYVPNQSVSNDQEHSWAIVGGTATSSWTPPTSGKVPQWMCHLDPPPPPPPPAPSQQPVKEQSATPNAPHTAWLNSYTDSPLPPDLVAKCKPLFCELCNASMNAPSQSKMHYEGKNHEKQVRLFLKQSQDQTTVKKQPKKPEFVSPLHCEPCGLALTSQAHAQQHFNGRNHQRRVNGLSPLKAGYFNERTGKWQRHPTAEGTLAGTSTEPETNGIEDKLFYCSPCGVNATSQAQLDTHLNGKSHKAKVGATAEDNQQQTDQKSSKGDYSIFRTPSGQYYCSSCNTSVNSESQFRQHRESKKHKTKQTNSKAAGKVKKKSKKKPLGRGPTMIAASLFKS